MISNITLGRSGLPEYLEYGRKASSQYSREEKDDRLFIDGSEEALKDSIDWVLKNKNWKNSYYHCTLAFTYDEWEQLSKEEGKLQEVVREYIRLNFPNHSLDELIFHAEAHVPKILYEAAEPKRGGAHAKYSETELIERHPHIHIGISQQNALYSGQVSAGGIKGIASRAKSIEFKQCCDEILCAKFDLIPAVAGEGKEPVKRKSLEENLKIWDRFKRAAQGRSKGKKLKLTFDTNIDVVDVVYGDLPKTNPPKVVAIKDEEIALKEIAKSCLKNLKQIYNPSEVERQIDGQVMARLREIDSGKLIPFISQYFGIPADKIRKSEGENKIEIFRDGKWKKNSNTDFCAKILGLDKEETVKLVTVFSALDASGVKPEALLDNKGRKRNIASIALDELEGYKFQNLPRIKLSVSRNLDRLLPEERIKNIKAKNPDKPVYSAETGFKTEYFGSLLEMAEALDYTKIAGYSVANFRDGKRSNENIESLNPVIILDIDSKYKEYEITIDEMREKLEALNISSLILPTASYSEQLHRFRVIIPTQKAFDTKGKPHTDWEEDYKAYADRFVDLLGLDPAKIDKTLDLARYKPAQFYYGSPSSTVATFSKGVVFDNSKILEEIYKERERINADIKLKNQEKDYLAVKSEIEVYIKNQDENLSKLDIGVDNDKALTRTVFKNINSTIDILEAAKIRYPNSKILREGRYQILYTGDSERDGNRNLIASRGVFNFVSRKIRTAFDFLKEYMDLINDRIKEFNNGFMIPMDRREKLKNFLMDNPLVVKEAEQPLEFRKIDTRNGNNYAKLVQHFFKEQYPKICLPNFKGIVKNLMHYMKNIYDTAGLENFKQHYGGLKVVDLHNGRIGYLNNISLKELRENGLSDEWTNPPKPLENKIKTRQISQKSPSNGEMNF